MLLRVAQCPDFVVLFPFSRLESSTVATAATVTSAPGRTATGGAVRPAKDRDCKSEIFHFSGMTEAECSLLNHRVTLSSCRKEKREG